MLIDGEYIVSNRLLLKDSPHLFCTATDSVVNSYTFLLPEDTRGVKIEYIIETVTSGPDGTAYATTVGDTVQSVPNVITQMSWDWMSQLANGQTIDLTSGYGSNWAVNNVFFGNPALKAGQMLRTKQTVGDLGGTGTTDFTFDASYFAEVADASFKSDVLTVFASDGGGETVCLKDIKLWVQSRASFQEVLPWLASFSSTSTAASCPSLLAIDPSLKNGMYSITLHTGEIVQSYW